MNRVNLTSLCRALSLAPSLCRPASSSLKKAFACRTKASPLLRPAGFTQTRFDQINFSATTFPFGPVAAIGAHTYDGWFVGGGTEIALSGLFGLPLPAGLFRRSEYRYSSFNSADLPLIGNASLTGVSEHMRPNVQTITTSLVYRFNWWGH